MPEWSLLLDCGLPTRAQPRAVLCTHTHVDHVAFLARNCMNRASSFNVFCPEASVEVLQSLLTATGQLRASSTRVCWNSALSSGKIVSLAPDAGYVPLCTVYERGQTPSRAEGPPAKRAKNAEVPAVGQFHPEVPARCKKLHVRAITLAHSVPTQGYVVAMERRKIRLEFAGLPQEELDQLRKDGVELNRSVLVPQLAYLCDCTSDSAVTAIRSLENDMPLAIIVECTYINDRDADEASRRKHVLWSKLRPVVLAHPNVQFCLVHFSKRYTGRNREELLQFAATLPPNCYAFY